jgi:hypothetical protein
MVSTAQEDHGNYRASACACITVCGRAYLHELQLHEGDASACGDADDVHVLRLRLPS